MIEPPVSIILAPHNGMDYIRACLDSVLGQAYKNIEVIIVDNASTDGMLEYVEHQFPQVRRIRSEANLAYGGGNNLGASVAKGDLLLFLNHDTVVTEDFLIELVKVMESWPAIGIAQSKILMASRRDLVDSAGAYLTRTGMWFHPWRGEPDCIVDREPIDILGAAGACVLVRREVFEALRGFDPDFVIYFDDADFSWRAKLLGHRIVMVPRSVIYHWGGATTQRLPSAFTVYHSFKNRLCSLIKLLSVRDLLVTLPLHLALCIGGALVYFLRLKPANGQAVLRALLWNLANLPQTLTKRREFMSLSNNRQAGIHGLIRPLPIAWFMRTASGYLTKW